MSMSSNSKIKMIPTGTNLTGKWNKKTYNIKRSLGYGENGVVYLVESLHQQYALKISDPSVDLSYEIQVIQRLNQTQGPILGFSILDIDDFYYDGQLYSFYVMPYKSGTTIKQHLYGQSEYEYIRIFHKIVNTLAEFHKQGFVFGDIKPEHILIDSSHNSVSIIDFGGVTANNEGVRQYTEWYDRGSWQAGTRKADPHYDLFSLAMVFIYIGIGKNKFERIYVQSRSLLKLYDIIPNIPFLTDLSLVLMGILKGRLKTTEQVLQETERLINSSSKHDHKKRGWIDWLFTSSLLFFIVTLFQLFNL